MSEAFIVAALRTAGARKGGRLGGWHPADLAAQVIDALVAKLAVDPYCRVIGARDALAVGDCSAMTGRRLPATAQLYIVPTRMSEMFSTHPATEKRIAALQDMAGDIMPVAAPSPAPAARRSALDPLG